MNQTHQPFSSHVDVRCFSRPNFRMHIAALAMALLLALFCAGAWGSTAAFADEPSITDSEEISQAYRDTLLELIGAAQSQDTADEDVEGEVAIEPAEETDEDADDNDKTEIVTVEDGNDEGLNDELDDEELDDVLDNELEDELDDSDENEDDEDLDGDEDSELNDLGESGLEDLYDEDGNHLITSTSYDNDLATTGKDANLTEDPTAAEDVEATAKSTKGNSLSPLTGDKTMDICMLVVLMAIISGGLCIAARKKTN